MLYRSNYHCVCCCFVYFQNASTTSLGFKRGGPSELSDAPFLLEITVINCAK